MVEKREKKTKKKEQEETWSCPTCEEENPGDEDVCQGCGSLREEPSYDQIADEEDE